MTEVLHIASPKSLLSRQKSIPPKSSPFLGNQVTGEDNQGQEENIINREGTGVYLVCFQDIQNSVVKLVIIFLTGKNLIRKTITNCSELHKKQL